MILSTVRSQPLELIANPDHIQPDLGWIHENIGFVSDEHQINVGITRSKHGLFIIGKDTANTHATYDPIRYRQQEVIGI